MSKYAGRDMVLAIAAPALTGVTGANATDLVTKASHGYVAGDAIVFNSVTSGGAGIVMGKRYYVIATGITANDFKFSATAGGSAFDFTTDIVGGSVSKFNTVGQVTSLGMAGSSRDLIDASAYGDAWKDYVTGQQDGAEITVDLALDPVATGQIALKTAYDAGTKTTFGMSHVASAFDIAFPAYVTSYERGGELGGLLQGSASLKIVQPGVSDTP